MCSDRLASVFDDHIRVVTTQEEGPRPEGPLLYIHYAGNDLMSVLLNDLSYGRASICVLRTEREA